VEAARISLDPQPDEASWLRLASRWIGSINNPPAPTVKQTRGIRGWGSVIIGLEAPLKRDRTAAQGPVRLLSQNR
jgi:hypothetical protein